MILIIKIRNNKLICRMYWKFD